MALVDLFNQDLKIINVGIPTFYAELARQGFDVINTEWRPVAGGDRRIKDLLERVRRSQASTPSQTS